MAIVSYTVIFAVLAPPESAGPLRSAIASVFPGDYLEIGPGQWLIASIGTAEDVSGKLGLTDGRSGTGVVLSVSGYFGRASAQIWEWLAAKMGSTRNA